MRNSSKKSSLSNGILLFLVGSIFTTIGVTLFIITIKNLIKFGISEIGTGIIMPCIFILVFSGFGITALSMGGKQIYMRIRQNKTFACGKELVAQIIDYKTASLSKGHNVRIRYALILAYNDNGEDKTFTTDYLFDINEFRYLQELDNIKVKVDCDFVTVCEPFPKDIYKLDSTYGIEMEFYKQKPVATLLRLWPVFFIAAVIFLIVSLIIGNGDITLVAIIIVFTINFPFAIPLAFYLIKWLIRKQ